MSSPRYYAAFRRGEKPALAPLPLQYAEYALWQRRSLQGDALAQQMGYWTQKLAQVPVLPLPTDRARPTTQQFTGATGHLRLPPALTDALQRLSQREGATLFMTLLAAFQVLLARHSGQEDIAVGVPIAGRTREETEGLIGFFVNTLVMRTEVSGNPGFRDLLQRVREVCLGAYTHQDVPFEKLVEVLNPTRDLGRNPLFDVMLNLVEGPEEALQLDGAQRADYGTRHRILQVRHDALRPRGEPAASISTSSTRTRCFPPPGCTICCSNTTAC